MAGRSSYPGEAVSVAEQKSWLVVTVRIIGAATNERSRTPRQAAERRVNGSGDPISKRPGRILRPGLRHVLVQEPLRAFTASVNCGATLNRSPTTPKSLISKMGASESLLTATIILEVCIPARCWMAPEIPRAT